MFNRYLLIVLAGMLAACEPADEDACYADAQFMQTCDISWVDAEKGPDLCGYRAQALPRLCRASFGECVPYRSAGICTRSCAEVPCPDGTYCAEDNYCRPD